MNEIAETAPSTAGSYILNKAVHLEHDVESWVNSRCGIYGENRSHIVNQIIRDRIDEEERTRNTA